LVFQLFHMKELKNAHKLTDREALKRAIALILMKTKGLPTREVLPDSFYNLPVLLVTEDSCFCIVTIEGILADRLPEIYEIK